MALRSSKITARSFTKIIHRCQLAKQAVFLWPTMQVVGNIKRGIAEPAKLVSGVVGEALFDDSYSLRENRSTNLCGPVAQFGSALPWHGRGRRFDPDQVHQFFPYSQC